MDTMLRVREDGVVVAAPPIRASGTPGGTSPLYGVGGLFGRCGEHPTLVNAMVGPIGIERWLNWHGTDIQTPQYTALTYVGTTSNAQSGMCADCGKPVIRRCTQDACLGRLCQQSNEHAFDQIGLMAGFGTTRKTLFGAITDPAGGVLIPSGAEIHDAFTLEVALAGYNLRLDVANTIWTGNPAGNLGGRWEFPGLQLLINTGKSDVVTGIACDGLDSQLYNYNAAVGAIGSPRIVDAVTSVIRSIDYRISGANMAIESKVAALVMHPIHWDCVASAWACEWGLMCANTTASAVTRQDAREVANARDQFMSQMALPVDGKMVPVILDNTLPLTPVSVGSETGFRGDIYYLTKEVEGAEILFGEYQDLNKTGSEVLAFLKGLGANLLMITDGGRFAVAATTYGGFCFDARILTKPRVLAIMPQLSGRIQNVTCVPLGSYPDVTGSGGTYEVGGGALASQIPYLGLYGDCGTR